MTSARRFLSVSAAVLMAAAVSAQTPASTFTLEQAIQYAGEHYPSVRAALEQVESSRAGISQARSAYLPRLDSTWQVNRATARNVFGQLLPQSVIPSMSGPVLADPPSTSVWGSAAGALASWEPLDFGLRSATVAGAEASMARAAASEALTRLDVQRAVGDAYLTVCAAQRGVAAAQADVDRRDVLARAVRVMADNQLRPGAEASRADAEHSAARTRLIQAQAMEALATVTLTRLIGMAGATAIDPSSVPNVLPPDEIPAQVSTHPLVELRQKTVEEARAQQKMLSRTDWPRMYLQSALFARGSGARPDGTFETGMAGLRLDRANWAAGFQLVVPNLFDVSSLRARKAAAAANERAQEALLDEATLTITADRQSAGIMVRTARAVAANAPVQLSAARETEAQVTARYRAGLTTLSDVAEAQNLLAQAEVQEELAQIDVWRALLAQAAAQGDLSTFLRLVHR